MANRLITLYEVWARTAGASGGSPSTGVTYKNPPSAQEVLDAWPYDIVVASEKFNYYLYMVAYLLDQIEKQGFLEWCASTAYIAGGMCMKAGNIYVSLQANNTNKDPETQTDWWSPYMNDAVRVVTDQIVDGVKTFLKFPIFPSTPPVSNYQGAHKKYVDDKFASVGSLIGAGISKSKDTVYTASTDGILVVITGSMDDSDKTEVFSDTNANPTTLVGKWFSAGSISGGNISTITVPIRNGYKYKVTATVTPSSILFYPLGA